MILIFPNAYTSVTSNVWMKWMDDWIRIQHQTDRLNIQHILWTNEYITLCKISLIVCFIHMTRLSFKQTKQSSNVSSIKCMHAQASLHTFNQIHEGMNEHSMLCLIGLLNAQATSNNISNNTPNINPSINQWMKEMNKQYIMNTQIDK